ncbi:myristoyl transferase [Ureibacillus massiliensis 4400831 = CIP 108448 = CCUG 49529]|uniref:Thiamine pyrimidine synthase n=2 Tax=cellular organisms TaxID=131567 RepID=A0A0A3J6W0_9BACL|nr:ABC transporter substrate-binding protein [Ureibacillus massiliensis]KGR90898.1 myristoyl transferase [Ureibacillus massiliensis 4400831 = CIP 108448 = CCUG 49529]
MNRKMNKTYRSLFVALLVLVTILAGCGSSETSGTSSEGGLTPVTLQLKWVPQAQFAGYFVALEKGYYEEEGLDVTIAPGGPDIVPEQQVANGAAQIGVDWVASLLPHQEQGMPLVQIAQIYQNSGLQLVSMKDSGIETPEDLAGKNVGNWMGGNEFELLALFDKYGLDPNSDFNFVKQAFTMDQFLTGELDAASVMTYNEYHVVLESGVPASDLNIIDMNEEGVAMLEDNLFANSEWLEDNKEVAAKFVKASIKGWKDAIENPEEAVDFVMAQVEEGSTTREHQLVMMEEVAKLVVPEGFDPANIGIIDADMFQQTADIAHQYGVIKEPADITKAYTDEIMDMVLAE